ncbi:MAG: roadblock/LC7 domain-containing protein [Methylococcaceae bacterium]
MHWFETKIAELVALSAEYADHSINNDQSATFDKELGTHRSEFMAALNTIVSNIALHSGVTGCLISYDGLVMAKAGEIPDFDALAAVTQDYVVTANKGAKILDLGKVQQMVVIGATHKTAIVIIGEMALCVLSPQDTNLSETLRESA